MKHWPSISLGISIISKSSRRALTAAYISSLSDFAAERRGTCKLARRMFAVDPNLDRTSASERKRTSYLDALEILRAGIAAVDPTTAIAAYLSISQTHADALQLHDPRTGKTHVYKASDYDSLLVISFGKAAPAMTMASLDVLSKCFNQVPLVACIVVTKDHHVTDEQRLDIHNLCSTWTNNHSILHILESAHPIPDHRSVDAAQLILQSVQKHASPKTLVLCCISGGGSSLVTAPLDLSTVSLTLNDLQETNELLLTSGMDISKINMIRKQLDAIKGGKLAVAAYPSTILSLILSDVVGDDVASIASGPTVPLHGCDHSRTNRSIPPIQDLLIQYQLDQSVPGSVIEAIMKDQDNAQHPIFTSMIHPDTRLSETVVVGNNHRALIAAARTAKTLGYHPIILGTTVEGEAKVIAGMYIAMAEYLLQQGRRTEESHSMALASHHPVCLLAGGETTVTLPPNHASTGKKGGRNQELALAAALLLQKSKHMEAFDDIVLGSIGSDGTDGPTDAAGSIVDGNTVDWIEMMNGGTMLAKDALKDHDAYNFLSSGSHNRQEDNDSFPHPLIKTGPTGTNVADICVILIRAYRNR